MAVIVLTNAHITVNSVVLSTNANSVTLNYEVEQVENTGFGSTGHTFQGGLQNNSVDIEFMQDFAAANVEATVYPLVGTTTTVIVRPNGATTSSTNPSYTISNAFLSAHTPVAATVGELAMTSLSFTGGTIAKATS
ncbi:MAG: radical SAM protein [Proteobacteria bacterium]|nr:radical SAM protein [Verrucomicrobiota bacterium]NBU11443.1 radical SAM protein [Pseudomonadota bacterium]NDE97101.1 radical SAM protein [Verrucomicrobiota bacterium]